MAESVRNSIGDFPRPKARNGAMMGFIRAIEALTEIDPTLPSRCRAVARDRALSLLHQEDMADAALDDPKDPTHYLWVLVATNSQLRNFARNRAAGTTSLPQVLSTLFGAAGSPSASDDA